MAAHTKLKTPVLKKALRILVKTIGILIAVLIILILLVQTAPVQNFLRKKAESYLISKLHTKVVIGNVYVGLPGTIILKKIFLEDKRQDTLVYFNKLSADLALFKLVRGNIDINELRLESATLKIKRSLPDTVFNFQFIVDAFQAPPNKQPNKKDTSSMQIAVHDIMLDKIRLVYDDVISGNEVDVFLGHFETRIDQVDLTKGRFNIPLIVLNGLAGKIEQHAQMLKQAVTTDTSGYSLPQFELKNISLTNIDLDYQDKPGEIYSRIYLDSLATQVRQIDLSKRIIMLEKLALSKTTASLRLGSTVSNKKDIAEQKDTDHGSRWYIAADQLRFDDDHISFDDDNAPHQVAGMDYAHLDAKDLSLYVNDLLISNDSISGDIRKGNFSEKSGFDLQGLQGSFLFANNQAYLKNLRLQTPGTLLQHSVVLHYPSIERLKKHIGELSIDADLNNSRIQVKDILQFVPSLRTQPSFRNKQQVFLINARMKGTVAHLKIDHLQLSGLQGTRIDVSGDVSGLPAIMELKVNLVIKQFSSGRKDLLSLIPARLVPPDISIPENFVTNGTITGNMNDVTANLLIQSTSGELTIKGNVKHPDDIKNVVYDASLSAKNLDIGSIFIKESDFGNVSLQLIARGRGFDPKVAQANIDCTISSVIFKKYDYRAASIKASLSDQVAKIDIRSQDPGLYFTLNGSADIHAKYPAINMVAVIDSLKPRSLHLTEENISYRGRISVNFSNGDPDHLQGELVVSNSLLEKDDQKIAMDSLRIVAGQNDTGQYIHLNSDAMNFTLDGHYRLTELGEVFNQLGTTYFSGNKKTPSEKIDKYDFTFSANITDKPILKTLLPSLQRVDPIHFKGKFNSENGWSADLNSPFIIYGNNRIRNFQVHVQPNSKSIDMRMMLQEFTNGGSIGFYNSSIDASVADRKINFALNIQDRSAKDKYHLEGSLMRQDSGDYTFNLKPDQLLLNYGKWNVSENNAIHFSSGNINANNFSLSKGPEELSIRSVSANSIAALEIGFTHFLLSTLTAFAGSDSLLANGEINGKFTLNNIKSNPSFTSDLNIRNLSIRLDTIGDVAIKINNIEPDKFSADVHITGRGNDLALTGNYLAKQDNDNFNLSLDIRKLQLASITGISMGVLKSASGSVNGKFSIRGSAAKPRIDGSLTFDAAGITPSMLNNYFSIDKENIGFNSDGIHFSNFTVLDSAKNKLVLNGSIKTIDFRNYDFDLAINAKNFQALNSTKRDNKLYYGKLFFNANLVVKGTAEQPSIDGTIKIDPKTKLTVVLPQEEPGISDRQGIIQFVNMKLPAQDSINNAGVDSFSTSSLKGFDISTNIIIDSSAELTLVIDENNGDHLTTKGDATLTAGIDRSGKITLSGDYRLSRGSYDLSFSLLHKQFKIQNGSSITWTGEATKANLNINAVYIANTSPIDLVDDQLAQSVATVRNTYLQKLPFEVHLKMKGELLKPDISFDIILPDDKSYVVSKDILTTVDAKLDMLRQDQGEMNKQVFALLLLNRFVGEDPFSTSTAALNAESLARSSVSKILTEQLNQLASNLVHGVDINFDLQSTDDYTTGQLQNRTDLNVGISKRLLNDRLTVSVGSDFELEGPQNVNANNQSNNLAGNIALNYKLSKDGRYMLRAYRKNDYDDVVEGYVIETGMGFIITLDYNHFREIFEGKKKRGQAESKK